MTAVVNTGDDDEFHGLWVCPDLDSVTYALAGANNLDTGWGLAGETFHNLDALDRYGAPTWFRLGDRDLATHLYRSERRRAGAPLSVITAEIADAWGLATRLVPMSDDRVATRITGARRGRRPRGARDAGVVRPGARRAAGARRRNSRAPRWRVRGRGCSRPSPTPTPS